MSSKAFMFLGLLVAMVLVISSQVTARELAEDASTSVDLSKETEKKDVAINDAKHSGGNYNNGGGYPGGNYNGGGGYPGGGYNGGGGNYNGGGYPGRGNNGGNYNGGRGNGNYNGGRGNGNYNGGRGRGNGCRYGCCGSRYNYKGGCRCCTYAGEKVQN